MPIHCRVGNIDASFQKGACPNTRTYKKRCPTGHVKICFRSSNEGDRCEKVEQRCPNCSIKRSFSWEVTPTAGTVTPNGLTTNSSVLQVCAEKPSSFTLCLEKTVTCACGRAGSPPGDVPDTQRRKLCRAVKVDEDGNVTEGPLHS